MVSWWLTILFVIFLSGGHAAPVDNVPQCRTEYVTTLEIQYREVEEEECTNVYKKVPVKISKLEPRKTCGEDQEIEWATV